MFFAGIPRTWKFLVTAMLVPVLLFGMFWIGQIKTIWFQSVSCVLGGWAVILFLYAVKMWIAYWRKQEVDNFERMQIAKATTADSVWLTAARGVHPDVYSMRFRERARRWEIVNGIKSADGKPYRVLHEASIVTEAFFVHFLKKSNKTSYMPKRMLSDKDKSWDPNGIVTAYEMYEAVEKLLSDQLMITRPYGKNSKGLWLPDWDPQSVAADFLIDLDAWTYENEDEDDERDEVTINGLQQVHAPAENDEDASWITRKLQDLTQRWDPDNPKSVLASELVSDEELALAQKMNVQKRKE